MFGTRNENCHSDGVTTLPETSGRSEKRRAHAIRRLARGGWALGLVSLVALAGCAAQPQALFQGNKGTVEPLQAAGAHEGVAVIYRRAGEVGSAAMVLVNDKVVASLLPGTYTQTRFCSGDVLKVVAADGGARTQPHQQALRISGAAPTYVRVASAAGTAVSAEAVDAASARQDLSGEWTGSHLISRYVPQCTPPAVPVAAPTPAPAVQATPAAAPVLLDRVQLGADALFAFNRSSEAGLLPAGRQAVDSLVGEIRQKGVRVERLRVVGHADRLGRAAHNERLSRERATAVQHYLQHAGVRVPIEVSGRGSAEPVSLGCTGRRATPELIACLQPDRRVVVDVLGQAPRAASQNPQ